MQISKAQRLFEKEQKKSKKTQTLEEMDQPTAHQPEVTDTTLTRSQSVPIDKPIFSVDQKLNILADYIKSHDTKLAGLVERVDLIVDMVRNLISVLEEVASEDQPMEEKEDLPPVKRTPKKF